MSNIKKLMASAAGGDTLNVEDVYNTFVYAGNGSTSRTINTGLDMSTEGGLVWIKGRTIARSNTVFDTERGAGKHLKLDNTPAEATSTSRLNSFNTNGFTLSSDLDVNGNGYNYVAHSFRKAPNFFDVVTYTGNGGTQTISHSLGSVPGMIWVKKYSTAGSWYIYHKELNNGTNPEDYRLSFDTGSTTADSDMWGSTAPTASSFTVGDNNTNENGSSYVAYIWAHHDGTGTFGPNGDMDIIRCGKFTTGAAGQMVDDSMGFAPGFLILKDLGGGAWYVHDQKRGITDEDYTMHRIDVASTESSTAGEFMYLDAEGINGNANYHGGFRTMAYLAIRQPNTGIPESPSEAFDLVQHQNDNSGIIHSLDFTPDYIMTKSPNSNTWNGPRLTMQLSRGDSTATQYNDSTDYVQWDYENGIRSSGWWGNTTSPVWYGWKRGGGFLDIVHYAGNSVAGRTIPHALSAVPEMVWIKRVETSTGNWYVYHKDFNLNGDNAPETDYALLNEPNTLADYDGFLNDTAPTATHVTVGNDPEINRTGHKHVMWCWASVDGISKIGTYTGNGTANGDSQFITTGFSPRFLLIKRYYGGQGQWIIFDTVKGIVTSGNDPFYYWNAISGYITNTDMVDVSSTGFTVKWRFSGSDTVNINHNNTKMVYMAFA